MFKLLGILWNSFKMALQELKVNKLRTFLSLFGITIGIFCIIGVLATIDSLKRYTKNKMQSIGAKVVWIDKWNYADGADGPDFPWWKYYKRPANKYADVAFLKSNSHQSENIALFLQSRSMSVDYESTTLQNISFYSVTNDFEKIQDLKIQEGRYIIESEFSDGSGVCVIGYKNAETLFGKPELAVGKRISINGKKMTIVGLIESQGSGGFGYDFDHCVLVSYNFFATMFKADNVDRNYIIVQAKEGVQIEGLIDELKGNMRQLRKLSPQQEDNFTVNDVSKFFGTIIDGFLEKLNLGGWAIAGLSLVVGAFGVANIMFVTVRERTSQIGLKKAIGAKKKTILTEFLLESAFLCIIGGLVGLFFVWILTLALSSILPFPIFIAPNIIGLALSLCTVLGVLSGIIPATIAARMDPVVAIRTK